MGDVRAKVELLQRMAVRPNGDARRFRRTGYVQWPAVDSDEQVRLRNQCRDPLSVSRAGPLPEWVLDARTEDRPIVGQWAPPVPIENDGHGPLLDDETAKLFRNVQRKVLFSGERIPLMVDQDGFPVGGHRTQVGARFFP